MPKYVGPYKVMQSYPDILRYTLNLQQEFNAQRILPSSHVSLLHLYHKSDNAVFYKHEVDTFYDFGDP